MRFKILILLWSIGIISCKTTNKDDVFEKKIALIESETRGKNLSIVFKVVGDSIAELKSTKLMFLVSNGDCSQCIEKGFKLFKEIKISSNSEAAVISAGLNSGYLQMKFNYTNYIYPDNEDLIRKTLSYSYTPVLLALDADNKVIESLIVNTRLNTSKKEKQFKKIFKE